MYKVSKLADKTKTAPNLKLSLDFQGKKIHPIKSMIFWYRWGEYTFDIRELRLKLGLKETKSLDMDFKVNECTRFQKLIKPLIDLVGDRPFLEVFEA
jgi:hypothetical protein